MEQRKRSSRHEDGSIARKLDKLASDIKKLPPARRDKLKEVVERRAYTTQEVANILGVSYSGLRRYLLSGEIKFFRTGLRGIRISADEVERFSNLVTMKTAAEMLGVAQLTLKKLVASGRLKAYRIGRPYRISKTDIDEFMKGESHPTKDEHGKE